MYKQQQNGLIFKWLEIIFFAMVASFFSIIAIMGSISLTGLSSFSLEKQQAISLNLLFVLFYIYLIIFYKKSKKAPLSVARPHWKGKSRSSTVIDWVITFFSVIQIMIFFYYLLKTVVE